MYTTLRTTLISATTLCLLATPAFAQVKQTGNEAALHAAMKELSVVERNIDTLEQRMAAVRREIGQLKALYFESGESKYKAEIEQRLGFLARLQHQLDVLNARAADLRAQIAKLSAPAPVVVDIGGAEPTDGDMNPTRKSTKTDGSTLIPAAKASKKGG